MSTSLYSRNEVFALLHLFWNSTSADDEKRRICADEKFLKSVTYNDVKHHRIWTYFDENSQRTLLNREICKIHVYMARYTSHPEILRELFHKIYIALVFGRNSAKRYVGCYFEIAAEIAANYHTPCDILIELYKRADSDYSVTARITLQLKEAWENFCASFTEEERVIWEKLESKIPLRDEPVNIDVFNLSQLSPVEKRMLVYYPPEQCRSILYRHYSECPEIVREALREIAKIEHCENHLKN